MGCLLPGFLVRRRGVMVVSAGEEEVVAFAKAHVDFVR